MHEMRRIATITVALCFSCANRLDGLRFYLRWILLDSRNIVGVRIDTAFGAILPT